MQYYYKAWFYDTKNSNFNFTCKGDWKKYVHPSRLYKLEKYLNGKLIETHYVKYNKDYNA